MWIADQWKDYEVIDTSKGEKLERWGSVIFFFINRFYCPVHVFHCCFFFYC